MKQGLILGIALGCLVAIAPVRLQAQELGGDDRLVPLLEVLARTSEASVDEVRAAIRDLVALGVTTHSGASFLLDRANIRFEPDPGIRAEALAAFVNCCPVQDFRNRMVALRVVRAANPSLEPDPRVRKAAIGALASFQCGEASERIHDSAVAANEPDPEVRKLARELVEKGR